MSDKLSELYSKRFGAKDVTKSLVQEEVSSLAVKKTAKGKGETGGLEPGEIPADTKSTKEAQTDSGAIHASVTKPVEAEERISPAKKDKGTDMKASNKKVFSFKEMYNQVIKEADIEDNEYSDELGDFPETEDEMDTGEDLEDDSEDVSEGEIYSELATLFSKLAKIKGIDMGDETEADMNNIPGDASMGEDTIAEMKNEPEPKELKADTSKLQANASMDTKGVKVSTKKATATTDKKRTGELEDANASDLTNKSKFVVNNTLKTNTSAFES